MDRIVFILFDIGILLIIGIVIACLIKAVCELLRPSYLKPKSFFLMENDSDLLEITAKNGLQVTVHYAEHIYADYTEEEGAV